MLIKINERLNRTLSIITAVVLIVMMLHIVASAVLRYFASAPIFGTNEIVQYWYLPLIALMGIPAAQLQNQHITVTLVTGRLRHWNAAIYKIFAALMGVLVSALWAWFGFQESLERMSVGSTAGVSGITIWPVYFLVPVIFIILAALYITDIIAINRHSGLRANEHEEALASETTNESR